MDSASTTEFSTCSDGSSFYTTREDKCDIKCPENRSPMFCDEIKEGILCHSLSLLLLELTRSV